MRGVNDRQHMIIITHCSLWLPKAKIQVLSPFSLQKILCSSHIHQMKLFSTLFPLVLHDLSAAWQPKLSVGVPVYLVVLLSEGSAVGHHGGISANQKLRDCQDLYCVSSPSHHRGQKVNPHPTGNHSMTD